jgi:hypothetical protein
LVVRLFFRFLKNNLQMFFPISTKLKKKPNSLETGTNRFCSLQSLENQIYTIDTRLRASPRHGGTNSFFILVSPIRRGGRPFGGGGIHRS